MNYLLTSFLSLFYFWSFAQSEGDTMYYNRFGDLTRNRDSAKYYRFTKEENNAYRFTDYDLKTGVLLKTGFYKDRELTIREGEFVTYDETGKIVTEKSNYTNDKLNGVKYVYYDTGELFYKEHYVNGEKHGDLFAYYKDGTLKREEKYEAWKMKSGTCYLPDGKEAPFFEFMTPASFRNGETAGLRKFLSENVYYPGEAVEKEITGKVYVQFVVSKTGELKEVSVRKSAHPILDKEAVRVVKSMPDWKPATLDGEKVDSFYTLPVGFNLN